MIIELKRSFYIYIILILILVLSVFNLHSLVNAEEFDQSTPGKGYMAFLKAEASGDETILNRTIVKSKMVKSATPQEKQLYKAMSMLLPKNVKIVMEKITGNQAILKVSGFVPICNANAFGNVVMIKEDDLWKVSIEEWKASTKEKYGSSTCTFGFGTKK